MKDVMTEPMSPSPAMPAPDTVTSLTQGPAAYHARTGWSWLAALPTAVVIFAVATFAGGISIGVLANALGITLEPFSDLGSGNGTQMRVFVLTLLVVQAIIILLTLVASDRFGSRAREALALAGPPVATSVYVKAFLGMAALLLAMDVAAALAGPKDMIKDLKPFAQLIGSDSWWLTLLAVGIGAPLSEELLFRGFLFSALAKSRIGIVGAALLTTAGWTALHGNYSVIGLLEVGAIGLYLSWVLWRTGSLRVTIFCHALYNSLLVALLAVVPLPAA